MNARILLLAVLLPLLSGCIFAVNTGSTTNTQPAGVYPGGIIPTTPVIAEINAAANLSLDSNRTQVLNEIAARPALTAPEQVHLVYTSMRVLSFDSSRQTVLTTLINNPSFTLDAKTAIYNELNRFTSDSPRMAIMTAMQNKPATAAPQAAAPK